MIKTLQRRFALSRQGAVDLIKGCIACVVQDISFMLPVGLLYYFVIDTMNGNLNGSRIAFYAVGSLVCLCLIFIATWFQYNATYLATYVESGVRRISLAERLRKIPLSFFGKKDLADLTNSIMGDCATLETAFSHYVPALAGSLISTTLIAICLFAYDWRMALAAVWVLPIAFTITFFSARIQEYFNCKSVAANVALESGVQECIESLQDLKSNNAEESYLKGLDKKIDYVEKRHIITELGTALFVVSSTLILKFGIATVALVGSTLLIRGEIDIPLFFMFLLVASRLYAPLEGALQNLAAVISTKTNIDRMNEILDQPIQTGENQLINKGYDIVFDHVGFAYNTGETVLKDVSFTAKQGEVTALVGPSGGGKTTLANLISRFFDPQSGTVRVGGVDVRDIPKEELMNTVSFVFQNSRLIKASIFENVRLGKPEATREEVMAALKNAQCDDILEKLPDGMDTVIGTKGVYLSGGEQQRIAIARVMLKNTPIIILDEATAFADPDNETRVQAAFSKLSQGKTVIMIAHRLSTVAGADRIYVVKDGQIAESGSSRELMERGGLFARMWQNYQTSIQWKVQKEVQ